MGEAVIPIRALRTETRNLISALLNSEKHISSDEGLQRDWRGLAELCGIDSEKIPSLERTGNPTSKVLDLWMDSKKDQSTIDQLLLFFEHLDRFDIVYDIIPLIEKDIEYFKQNPNGFHVDYPYIDDQDILTIDDAARKINGLPLQIYDAFVLFADDDIHFARELVETMEKQYNLKLCVKDRDLVGGALEHDSVVQLITKRCGRLVVIISPAFFESPVHKFMYSVGHVEALEQKTLKIIPCIYKPCENLPPDFRMYFTLYYSRKSAFYNFWERLYGAIKAKDVAPTIAQGCQDSQRRLANLNINENPPENMEIPRVMEPPTVEQTTFPTLDSPVSPTETNEALKKKRSLYGKLKQIVVQKPAKPNEHSSDDKGTSDVSVVKSKKKIWKNIKAKIAIAS